MLNVRSLNTPPASHGYLVKRLAADSDWFLMTYVRLIFVAFVAPRLLWLTGIHTVTDNLRERHWSKLKTRNCNQRNHSTARGSCSQHKVQGRAHKNMLGKFGAAVLLLSDLMKPDSFYAWCFCQSTRGKLQLMARSEIHVKPTSSKTQVHGQRVITSKVLQSPEENTNGTASNGLYTWNITCLVCRFLNDPKLDKEIIIN